MYIIHTLYIHTYIHSGCPGCKQDRTLDRRGSPRSAEPLSYIKHYTIPWYTMI